MFGKNKLGKNIIIKSPEETPNSTQYRKLFHRAHENTEATNNIQHEWKPRIGEFNSTIVCQQNWM